MSRILIVLLLVGCLAAPSVAQSVQSGSLSGIVVAQRENDEGADELLIGPESASNQQVDEVTLRLPKGYGDRLTAEFLPAGWRWFCDGKICRATGPAQDASSVRIRLGLADQKPPAQVDVEGSLSGRSLYRKKKQPVVVVPPVEILSTLEGLLALPGVVSPDDQVQPFFLVPQTTAGWTWSFSVGDQQGGEALPLVGSPFVSGPGITPGLGLPELNTVEGRLDLILRIIGQEPYGEIMADLTQDILLLQLPPTEVPSIVGATPRVFVGHSFCVCGYFPNPTALASLRVGGDPLGAPQTASSFIAYYTLPPNTAPGPVLVTGDPTVGYAATDEAQVIALVLGGHIDRDALMSGESTEMRIWIEGIEVPLEVDLENTTPGVISLANGNKQTIMTSGGNPNQYEETVHAGRPGNFNIDYELATDPCPCAKGFRPEGPVIRRVIVTPVITSLDDPGIGDIYDATFEIELHWSQPPGCEPEITFLSGPGSLAMSPAAPDGSSAAGGEAGADEPGPASSVTRTRVVADFKGPPCVPVRVGAEQGPTEPYQLEVEDLGPFQPDDHGFIVFIEDSGAELVSEFTIAGDSTLPSDGTQTYLPLTDPLELSGPDSSNSESGTYFACRSFPPPSTLAGNTPPPSTSLTTQRFPSPSTLAGNTPPPSTSLTARASQAGGDLPLYEFAVESVSGFHVGQAVLFFTPSRESGADGGEQGATLGHVTIEAISTQGDSPRLFFNANAGPCPEGPSPDGRSCAGDDMPFACGSEEAPVTCNADPAITIIMPVPGQQGPRPSFQVAAEDLTIQELDGEVVAGLDVGTLGGASAALGDLVLVDRDGDPATRGDATITSVSSMWVNQEDSSTGPPETIPADYDAQCPPDWKAGDAAPLCHLEASEAIVLAALPEGAYQSGVSTITFLGDAAVVSSCEEAALNGQGSYQNLINLEDGTSFDCSSDNGCL